jgi:Putative DNA-binding domain
MSLAMQSRFAAALIDQDAPVPSGVTSWSGVSPAKRFGVYRNNVAAGLTKALAARFPAAERIVGAEFFAAMARDFVLRHPPNSPVLLTYGDAFADYVERFEPAAGLPYLPDVIRLENARARAYHAADATPLAPEKIAAVQAERLGDLIVDAHPAVSVMRSAYPVVTIWAMNAGEAELGPIDDWTGEDALVVRPHLSVLIHRLPPGGATFLERLVAKGSLGSAVEAAMNEARDFDLAANLAGLLGSGVVIGIRNAV